MMILTMFLVSGLQWWTPASATESGPVWNPATVESFYATITAVSETPLTDSLPGIHLEVHINNRNVDVYLGPADFISKFDLTFYRGEDVHVLGSRIHAGNRELVLAGEITAGSRDRATLYLRDSSGPLW